jgi:hypothetical protein
VTRPPWEYLFQAFSRTNFPDIYDAFWIASLVLLAVLVVLYNLRTRALHRHPPYLDLWEWLLWTGVITFMIVTIGATFLFDFFIVLFALLIGVAVMVYARFLRFPPLFAAYEQKMAKQRFFSKVKFSRPETTIRQKSTRPGRRSRRRR